MGGAVFLPCWLSDMRNPSTRAYWLLGGARSWGENGSLLEGSHQWILARTDTACVFVPQWATAPSTTGGPPILTGWSGPVSYEVTAFFSGSWCTQDLVCASRSGVSLSPSPVEFLQSNPTGLQSQILWVLLLPLPDPQAGEPDMGLRTFTPVRELLWYNYFPVCGLPTQHVWDFIMIFIMIVPLLQSRCDFFFVFGCRVSLWVGSSIICQCLFSS